MRSALRDRRVFPNDNTFNRRVVLVDLFVRFIVLYTFLLANPVTGRLHVRVLRTLFPFHYSVDTNEVEEERICLTSPTSGRPPRTVRVT